MASSESTTTSTTTKVLRLKSSDNEIFGVEEKAALQSETIKSLAEDGYSEDVIPLFNVEKKTLAKIVEWLNKHASGSSKEELKRWDADFVDVDKDVLYDLLLASNYLNIEVLLHQLAQKVADMIKGKKPEEIRQLFGIKNDFTPEEEAEIRRENAWAFE
ncbi:unnamed protein product [Dovyalis caffra]|uniref:SKP1-like protein n=1 Tax=Dovyalis caffra TaxID=77055 RepID=A0AAV1SVW6_9ROSI|nr:unnamed protein product [Dovyalis caffra]